MDDRIVLAKAINFTEWREAVAMPVIVEGTQKWNTDEFEQILLRAVARSAGVCIDESREPGYPNGRVCMTFSGGLDSSFCLAVADELTRKTNTLLRAFTIGESETHPDMWYARLVSKDLHLESCHNTYTPSPENIRLAEEELYSLWKDEPRGSGNVAVYMIYEQMALRGVKYVIAHDGIDELLGGYWEHRKHDFDPLGKAAAFQNLWNKLEPDHLSLLERKAKHFGIRVVFPYLQREVVEYIAKIPLNERTMRAESKIPLRNIAKKYLPAEIIARRKNGFCSALER